MCGAGDTTPRASVYTLPATLSTTGSDLPCSFSFSSDVTPTLTAASSARAAVNTSLTLTGTKFASGSQPPTVKVCGDRTCVLESYDATSITCVMPDCPEAHSSSPILVHVPPVGFATQSGSVTIGGVLAITAIDGPIANGKVAGSAAGGVLLTIHGTGFQSAPSLMKVTLRSTSGSVDIANCTIVGSYRGFLECLTGPTSSPLADAGTQATVRVATLESSSGNEIASVALVDGFWLLSAADSMTLTGLEVTAGSTAGGLLTCINGTNLDLGGATPTVTLGDAPCDPTNANTTATRLCCITSAGDAGKAVVSVRTPQIGNALTTATMPVFMFVSPPAIHGIHPTSGHAGSTVIVTMNTLLGGFPTPHVTIGGFPCTSVAAVDIGDGATNLSCSVSSVPPGVHPVRVHVPTFGDAAVPNTLEDALQDSKDARVVTSATRPFVIEHVNDAWVRLCGFSADEAVGKTLACLQGPLSERDEITKIVDQAARGHACSALITNYTKQGQRFQNFLRVVPLVRGNDDAQPSHMLGVLQDVQPQLAG